MMRCSDNRLPLVALLCVAGQLATSTHLVLVRHEACPEHGELLHGEAAHAGHGSQAADTANTAAVSNAAQTAAEPHDHEHCSVPCERRALAVPAASSVRFIAGPAACAFTGEQRALRRGTPLLALAPKQSPPRA
jgi:hypothetical protein